MKAVLPKEILLIPLSQIVPNNFNPNVMTGEEYEQLKASMKILQTVVQPISIRRLENGKYEIIDGYHRWEAANELGWSNIRCEVFDNLSEYEAKVLNYASNHNYGNIDPFKEATLFYQMVEKGTPKEKICQDFNIQRKYLDNRLRLMNIDHSIREKHSALTLRHWEIISSFGRLGLLMQEELALQAKKFTVDEFEQVAPRLRRKMEESLSEEEIRRELLEASKVELGFKPIDPDASVDITKEERKDGAEGKCVFRIFLWRPNELDENNFKEELTKNIGLIKKAVVDLELKIVCPHCGSMITQPQIERAEFSALDRPYNRMVRIEAYQRFATESGFLRELKVEML